MRHLKSYTLFERVSKETKIFENIDIIINDFRDILLELTDENFNIRVEKGDHHAYSKSISIIISKDGGNFDFWTERNIGELTPFRFIEVKEYLLRILSYAKDEGWYDFNFEVVTPYGIGNLTRKPFNDAYKDSVKIKDDEILCAYYDVENNQRVYKPIKDDEKILCVYIGLGK